MYINNRPKLPTYCSLMQGRKRFLPDDGDDTGLMRRLLTVRVALIFILPLAIIVAIVLLSPR